MCNLNQEFKLCTCGGDDLTLEEIGWILKRHNPKKEMSTIRGKPYIPTFSKDQQQSKTRIAAYLNSSNNCFDFDYQPQEDDFLQIKESKESHNWFAYRFKNGQWEEDASTVFDEWRMKLDAYEQGKLKA